MSQPVIMNMTTHGLVKVEKPHEIDIAIPPEVVATDIYQYFVPNTRPLFVTIALSMEGDPNSLDVRIQGYIGNQLVGGAHIRRDYTNMVVAEASMAMYIPVGMVGYFAGKAGGNNPNSFRISITQIEMA